MINLGKNIVDMIQNSMFASSLSGSTSRGWNDKKYQWNVQSETNSNISNEKRKENGRRALESSKGITRK